MILLRGCRADSLLGYLKALGVMRLVATQRDHGAKGAWMEGAFTLATDLSESDLLAFLINSYAPTPILNPWNSGAGFDGKMDAAAKTMQAVVDTKEERWAPYRAAVTFVRERYVATGTRAGYLEQAKDKAGFVKILRSECPEPMLHWLDAAVVLSNERLAFPYILGSGGNDGRLDFAANFAARALDVCGDRPLATARELLVDSLMDTSSARLLHDVAIGQFSPRHAGGANASNGYAAASLVNPWDYVLALEGAICFTGGLGRRTERTRGHAIFPFAVRRVAGGYATASAGEEERGELWLPVWDGHASYASVTDLLRKGRMDLPSQDDRAQVRSAVLASEAAAAVVTLGLQRGVRSLQRVAFVQRNGLAYSAVTLGAVQADSVYDRGIGVITQRLAGWIERTRGLTLGAASREALRRLDDAIFAFPNTSRGRRAKVRQDMLIAVADLDRSLAHNSDYLSAPRLPAETLEWMDDKTVVHRAAAAVASLGGAMRATDTRDQLRVAGNDAIETLRQLIEFRVRKDAVDHKAGWLEATRHLTLDDVSQFITLEPVFRVRFNSLLRAYALSEARTRQSDGPPSAAPTVPAAYAVLKMGFDDPDARDERILRLLFTRNAAAAMRLAVQRARAIKELPRAPRDVSCVQIDEPEWIAATLILPIVKSDYPALRRVALSSAPPTS